MRGRFLLWLIPLIALALLLTGVLYMQQAAGVSHSFADDTAYLDFSFARSLAEYQSHFIDSATPVPALRNALWRIVLAAVSAATGSEISAAYIVGTISALALLCIFMALSMEWVEEPRQIVSVGLIFVSAPFVVLGVVGGQSTPLAGALVLGACFLYVRGLSKPATVLPISAAWLIGAAMWIRLEFAVFWVAMLLHAVVVSVGSSEGDRRAGYAVVRGLTGVCALALLTLPLLASCLWILRVPWPITPSDLSPLVASAESGVTYTYGGLVGVTLPAAVSLLWRNAGVGGSTVGLLAAAGCVSLLVVGFKKKDLRKWSFIPFVAIVVPLLVGLLAPVLGWEGARAVVPTLVPLLLLAFAFGVLQLCSGLTNLVLKRGDVPEVVNHSTVLGSVTIIVVLFMLGLQVDGVRQVSSAVKELNAIYAAIDEALSPDTLDGRSYISDRVGRLAYDHRVRTQDLTGESSPVILTCLNRERVINFERAAERLRTRPGDVLILWNPENLELLNYIDAHEVHLSMADDSIPRPGVWVID